MILDPPIVLTRPQVISIWSTLSSLGIETHLEIFEVKEDGEIWYKATSPYGFNIYVVPTVGGSRSVHQGIVKHPLSEPPPDEVLDPPGALEEPQKGDPA